MRFLVCLAAGLIAASTYAAQEFAGTHGLHLPAPSGSKVCATVSSSSQAADDACHVAMMNKTPTFGCDASADTMQAGLDACDTANVVLGQDESAADDEERNDAIIASTLKKSALVKRDLADAWGSWTTGASICSKRSANSNSGPWYAQSDVPTSSSSFQNMVSSQYWSSLQTSLTSRKELAKAVCAASVNADTSDAATAASQMMRWCHDMKEAGGSSGQSKNVVRNVNGVTIILRFGVNSWAQDGGTNSVCGCFSAVGVPGDSSQKWASHKDTLGCYHPYHGANPTTFGRSSDSNGWLSGWHTSHVDEKFYGYESGGCVGAKHNSGTAGPMDTRAMSFICPIETFNV